MEPDKVQLAGDRFERFQELIDTHTNAFRLPPGLMADMQRMYACQTGRTVTALLPAGYIKLTRTGDGSITIDERVNRNPGTLTVDPDEICKAAFSQPDDVFTFTGNVRVGPAPVFPLGSGDKKSLSDYEELRGEYWVTLKATEAAGPGGRHSLDAAHAALRKEYETLSRAAQERAGSLPVKPGPEYTDDSIMHRASVLGAILNLK